MSIASLLTHTMDVEAIAAVPPRDSSGGIIEQWAPVFTGVPCVRNPLSADRMADFAIAGMRITDQIITLQGGILVSQRLKFIDGDATVYLRVDSVKYIPGRGTIGSFYEVMAEEIRLQ